MIAFKVLLLTSLAALSVLGQQCPNNAAQCLQDSGFTNFPSDPWRVCTTSVKQLFSALYCTERCLFNIPTNLLNRLENANETCSGMPGCQNYTVIFEEFMSCYENENAFRSNINQVISLFNSRLPNTAECLKLRKARSCMKGWARQCGYLDYFYRQYLARMENYDLALYICGAENVESTRVTDRCSDNMYNATEAECSMACELSSTTTAGDLCNLLQTQAMCIEAKTRGCSLVGSSLLLPRLDSYSFVNDLFFCNITAMGVLIKPADSTSCNFKRVMNSCFGVKEEARLTLKDVQKLLNADLDNDYFRRKHNNKESEIRKCIRAYWACMLPLARVFEKPTPPVNFLRPIGTFPLNSWGLRDIFASFTSSPPWEPTKICTSPGYDNVRTTTLPPNLYVN